MKPDGTSILMPQRAPSGSSIIRNPDQGAVPAVFFDRDGVLNVDHGYVGSVRDFQWVSGAVDAIRYLNRIGALAIVVTNQSGIARGFYKESDFLDLSKWMFDELVRQDAHLDAIYFCPHHPEATIEELRGECRCRKPRTGMLEQAAKDFSIDRERSLLIGDREGDIAAATAFGIPGYLFTGGDLMSFVQNRCSNLG